MTAHLLLHLVEPAAWRTALTDGELRPPSLAEAGFVHLSTPEQVHLPAQRLFPGRRDLVLLVVDPSRLTDPVRWEPGVPGDPEAMRFPHLYGPLPTSAVGAVVPYRPPLPPVLPGPGDALGRGLAHLLSLPVRRAPAVRDVPGGVAVSDARFARSREDNRLLLSDPVDAATVEDTAADVAAEEGWPARAATLRWPGAGDVAAALNRRGWSAEELVLMGRAPGHLAGGDRAEVVDEQQVHDLWERSWREELGCGRDDVIAELVAREARTDAVVAVSHVVVRDGGRVVATGQLRVDGGTAAIESLVTDEDARGRGHGAAILARLLGLAADAGCDLVVLEAAAEDWPRQWYARRGFAELGSTWDVATPQAGASTESSR